MRGGAEIEEASELLGTDAASRTSLGSASSRSDASARTLVHDQGKLHTLILHEPGPSHM